MAVIPNLAQALDEDELLSEQVVQLDSKNMNHAVWQRLAQRCLYWLAQDEVRGLVVTHGTDTLEETAWFLQQVLPTAEACGVKLALHPDDPPVEQLRGTARLVNQPEKYERLLNISRSKGNFSSTL